MRGIACGAGLLMMGLIGCFGAPAQAQTTTFTGPWDPTNPANGFNLSSFFPWGCQAANPSLPGGCTQYMNYTLGSMSLSAGASVLTLTFTDDPNGVGLNQVYANSPGTSAWSSFSLNPTPADQPAGPVSFDWSVTFTGSVTGAEFGIAGTDYGPGRSGTFDQDTVLSGHASGDDSSLLSFGAGFNSSDGAEMILTISNLQAPSPVPEPAALGLFAASVLGMGLLRRRSS